MFKYAVLTQKPTYDHQFSSQLPNYIFKQKFRLEGSGGQISEWGRALWPLLRIASDHMCNSLLFIRQRRRAVMFRSAASVDVAGDDDDDDDSGSCVGSDRRLDWVRCRSQPAAAAAGGGGDRSRTAVRSCSSQVERRRRPSAV